jgi:hypothetical protein
MGVRVIWVREGVKGKKSRGLRTGQGGGKGKKEEARLRIGKRKGLGGDGERSVSGSLPVSRRFWYVEGYLERLEN